MTRKEMIGKYTKFTTPHIFNVDKLEPGDILLSRIPMNLDDASTWSSYLIQTLKHSRFSAAALHVANGVCVEAVGSGVARLPLAKTGVLDINNVRILRARKNDTHSSIMARGAAACGQRYLQRGYCAPKTPRPQCDAFHNVQHAAVMGSGLVASAYMDSGFALLGDKDPYATFPGDLLDSPALEDVTTSVLQPLTAPLRLAFHLDDSTLMERVHRWEVATQLKILCNAEVRRILTLKSHKPLSMRELELLIAQERWRALDEAVLHCLKWYRYADAYRSKLQLFLGDITLETPGINRLLATALYEDQLVFMTQAIAVDLQQIEAERSQWQKQCDFYNEMQLQYKSKTFSYLLTLYQELLTESEHWLRTKLPSRQQLYSDEARRREVQLQTA